MLASGTGFLALLGLWWVHELFDFLIGSLLATWNFYFLASFIQRVLGTGVSAVASMLIRFYVRIALTGFVLYLLLARTNASVPALIVGLSTVVITLIIWGASWMTRTHV